MAKGTLAYTPIPTNLKQPQVLPVRTAIGRAALRTTEANMVKGSFVVVEIESDSERESSKTIRRAIGGRALAHKKTSSRCKQLEFAFIPTEIEPFFFTRD
jgi:hypothetical protein